MDERMERLKRVLIEGLHLQPLTPAELDPDEPLFGGRLGLDSVDALELVMEVERHFGVQIQDDAESRKILHSLRTLADHLGRSSAVPRSG